MKIICAVYEEEDRRRPREDFAPRSLRGPDVSQMDQIVRIRSVPSKLRACKLSMRTRTSLSIIRPDQLSLLVKDERFQKHVCGHRSCC